MDFILIEDHNLVRQGVSKIIEEKSDFHCAGTFAGINETKAFLADYCKRGSTYESDYEPLLCIVDINLGEEDGLSLIRFIKDNYPKIYCICYSMFKGAGIVEQAVSAGAVGYVSKNADLQVLLQAMKKAGDSSFFMEDSLTSDYVIYTNLYNSLTKRERELTGLFFQHKSEEEIAASMGITIRAVDNYMTRILSKLGVASKKELMGKFGDMG
jgi:two-component system uhpT operon response regulator UhpA